MAYKEPKYTAPAAYQSQYSTQIGDLINKAVNREQFAYDPATDTSYQALAKQNDNRLFGRDVYESDRGYGNIPPYEAFYIYKRTA